MIACAIGLATMLAAVPSAEHRAHELELFLNILVSLPATPVGAAVSGAAFYALARWRRSAG